LICLEAPLALAISPNWSCDYETPEKLSSFYKLISSSIQLKDLFRCTDSRSSSSNSGPTRYLFRGMVCYYGLHYVSIFHESENSSNYLLFDDCTIRNLGDWPNVVETSIKARYQPVLLLYELLLTDNDTDVVMDTSTSSSTATTLTSSSISSESSDSLTINRSIGNAQTKESGYVQDYDCKGAVQLDQPAVTPHDGGRVAPDKHDSKACQLDDKSARTIAPLIYGSQPLIYEVRLIRDPITNEYGLIPLVRDQVVIIEGFHRQKNTGNVLPAENSGIGLLDELIALDGEMVHCEHESEVVQLFSGKMKVSLRLRSSYLRTLTFYCMTCMRDTSISSSDMANIHNQFQSNGSGFLVCDTCDSRHQVNDMETLEQAMLAHTMRT
jgi:hypothetical protein